MEEHSGSPLKEDAKLQLNARNTIDGLLLLRQLMDASIAAAFFDPQYRGILDKLSYGNEGVQRGQRRAQLRQMQEEEILSFLREINRVLRPSGHLFLWVDKFHLCEGVMRWCTGTALELVDMLVWEKPRIGMGYRTRRKAEYLVILQKRPKRARGIWVDHTIPDVWADEADTKIHAHAKPVELQRRLLLAVTQPDDWVLDPAAGSYSVLAACRQAGRGFIGGDIRP